VDELERGYLMAVCGALVWTPRLLRSWLDALGSPRALLDAVRSDEVNTPPGVQPFGASALERLRAVDADAARTALDDLERSGARSIADGDPEYPPSLRDLVDAPPVVYVRGTLAALEERSVAIVGSRAASAYGRGVAASLAVELGGLGACIVSGLARGIDAAAHKGALSGGAPTVAVVGSGLSALYPPYHSLLADDIVAAGGAVLSEFPPHFPPLAHQFPMRNRLVAAIAQATIVVEAGARSGALITARLANDIGRPVFAIPGDVGRATSAGTNGLIKDGVPLITGALDAADLLGWKVRAAGAPGESSGADPILALLGPAGMEVDELAARVDIDLPSLLARLTMLEILGAVERLPGGSYAAVKTARSPNASAR
jgi:DNA processing protein